MIAVLEDDSLVDNGSAAEGTLYNNIWDSHVVGQLPTGEYQLFIGLHLIHEVTSPQAFGMLRENGWKVAFPERTYATPDHIIPTHNQNRPFQDEQAEIMLATLEKNTGDYGIRLFGLDSGRQGIVHIIGPELGLTQPGMTIACGDSHTSTHGAFGNLAFGIGTSEVRDVLATQCLATSPLKVRRIDFDGRLQKGVYAKDMILQAIRELGVDGGNGFVYEYAGSAIEALGMDGRMTICNMSVEGGAKAGYVNPDSTTFDYLKGREFVPKGSAFDEAVKYWRSIVSQPNAVYDESVSFDVSDLAPMVTWGINPGHAIGIDENLPKISDMPKDQRASAEKAYKHMGLKEGEPIKGTPIDVAFMGSCNTSRITDLREMAKIVEGRRVADTVKVALVVPGSQQVKLQAENEGLDKIFEEAGFEWRDAGCSMCIAMNPDKLKLNQRSASANMRNFIGRQGSPEGRTHLMSAAMVGAAAIAGYITDAREYCNR